MEKERLKYEAEKDEYVVRDIHVEIKPVVMNTPYSIDDVKALNEKVNLFLDKNADRSN